MENFLRPVLFSLAALLGLALMVFGGLLLYGTVTEFKPPAVMEAERHERAQAPLDSTLSLMIWNLGYAGLGADHSFFMDGGKDVRPSRADSERYLQGILDFLRKEQETDFILLQEVDRDSRRSYGTDQAQAIAEVLPGHNWYFAPNFKVRYIPVPFDPIPFSRPIGHVHSGLVSLTKASAASAERYSFPGRFPWPEGIFHLDRCFLEKHYPLGNGRDLVVINSHNSAYDGGLLKAEEMAMLREHLLELERQGHYIIVGSDWNQCPPDFDPKTFKKDESEYDQQNIAPDYLPEGWTWAYDPSTPTNRKVSAPYQANSTFTTVIDFFLLSPNVELLEVSGVHLDFANSDHQPVRLTVKLR